MLLSLCQLQHYLQEVSFNASGEEVNFDLKGGSIPSYDLMNWQRNPDGNPRFVKVGLFDGTKDSGKELVIQEEAIVWAGHQNQASCCHCVFTRIRCQLVKFCTGSWI